MIIVAITMDGNKIEAFILKINEKLNLPEPFMVSYSDMYLLLSGTNWVLKLVSTNHFVVFSQIRLS